MESSPETWVDIPPQKRVKTVCGEAKTLLFVISRYPWKATVMLPSMHAFSLRDVRNAKNVFQLQISRKGSLKSFEETKIFKWRYSSMIVVVWRGVEQHPVRNIKHYPSSSSPSSPGNPTNSTLGSNFCGV